MEQAGRNVLGRRVRDRRTAMGLTQAELAVRAGVSRQLVGAVEADRHLPRVDAAAALARVLDTNVEALLAPDSLAVVGVVDAPRTGHLVRCARVGDQRVSVTVRPSGAGWPAADGVVQDGEVRAIGEERLAAVVVGCDPAIGLTERLLVGGAGPGVLSVNASSAAAIDAIAGLRAHAAVVHGIPDHLPTPPVPVLRWRVARWQVGIAGARELPDTWVQDALVGRITVVQREPGAGSQLAFERARGTVPADPVPTAGASAGPNAPPIAGSPGERAGGASAESHGERAGGPIATGHLEAAAWARRDGIAAVTIEPAARSHGLAFHALEEHVAELWVVRSLADEPGVRRFVAELLDGARLRRHLDVIGGYDLAERGTELVP